MLSRRCDVARGLRTLRFWLQKVHFKYMNSSNSEKYDSLQSQPHALPPETFQNVKSASYACSFTEDEMMRPI
jgi:hypothetical protein